RRRQHPPGGVHPPRRPRRRTHARVQPDARFRDRGAHGADDVAAEEFPGVREDHVAEPTQDDLRKIYADSKTIAVVGASADEPKASHRIPRYLQSQGYRIIPVSPKGGEILGEKVFTSLKEIDEPVDVVDVFRPSE